MPNLYGVANAPGLPVFATNIGNANIPCPAGSWTPVITSPAMIAPSAGYFYCMIWTTTIIAQGATVATALFAAAQIGAGSVANQVGLGGQAFVANATELVSLFTFSSPSQTAWQGAGSTVSLNLQAVTNAVTCYANSEACFVLLRAPDQ